MDGSRIADIIEIEQLLARYAAGMTMDDVEAVLAVFAPDGTYSAFGERYGVGDFPELMAAAPKGVFSVSTPAIEFDGQDAATGVQPLCFVAQTDHSMRIGYYTDSYRRTADGWRLQTRAMTFLRRNGSRDSGRPHDPRRPVPGGKSAG
ncbi:nuclear transport factor 2 family protein [Actinomadura chokoriensis]|uniref:Nuclear transport factor 2 family protein n=1 Tax=Actinomadura chokoriensis TaxID=454156 RepID=A0ABV4QUL3_9ACTN